MKYNSYIYLIKKTSILGLILTCFFCAPPAVSAGDIEAITRPSADIELSFVQPGKIQEINIQEGTMVKNGALLIGQDDTIEMVQNRILTARAKNTTRIEIAKAKLKQKEKDFEKMESARTKGAVTDWELEHSRLDLETALLDLQLAKYRMSQKRMQCHYGG